MEANRKGDSQRAFDLFGENNPDEALRYLDSIEAKRPLTPAELVLKGRCIQLGTGGVIADSKEAEKAFSAALDLDGTYVPALIELGWFYYAPEDEASQALPFFDLAIEVSLHQLKEAIKGKAGCLEELASEAASKDFLQQIAREGSKLGELEAETFDETGNAATSPTNK